MQAKLTPKTIELIKYNANVFSTNATEITTTMYKKLFRKYPMFKDLFKDVPNNQHNLLVETLSKITLNIDQMHIVFPLLNKIAITHVQINVRPNYYIIFEMVFIESIKEVIGNKVDTNVLRLGRKYINIYLIS